MAFLQQKKNQQHIKLVSTIPHVFVLTTRTICFQKICTYPFLSEQISHSQQSMLLAYESHPVPILYNADGMSHPVPLLYCADGIQVTTCPCILLCQWHTSHILILYTIMLMASVSHDAPILYNDAGISHILSLQSIVLMAYESRLIPVSCYTYGIQVTSCPCTLLCRWHKSHSSPVLLCRQHKSHILSLCSFMLTD
jgi:hypothetical protein